METVQYLKDRIIYLKKCEMEYFDKQYTLPHGHLLRKQYREFSNEFQARRQELEQLEKLLSESTHETPKVITNEDKKEVCPNCGFVSYKDMYNNWIDNGFKSD